MWVFNGSDFLVVTRRDMNATWLPIDQACARLAASLWGAYATARAAARDLDDIYRYMPLALSVDEERRRADRDKKQAAIDALLRRCLERGEGELWARPGSAIANPTRIPISAVGALEFDYERRTAVGDGPPPLYDLHIRLPAAAPVKRWRKRLAADDIKGAALAIAKTYHPGDPPTADNWWKALKALLGETVTRKTARNALRDWAPHLQRKPGQKRNRRS